MTQNTLHCSPARRAALAALALAATCLVLAAPVAAQSFDFGDGDAVESAAAITNSPADEVVAAHTALTEWALDLRFTPAQRDRYRAFIEGYWRDGDAESIRDAEGSVANWGQMGAVPAAQRAAMRRMMTGEVLANLHANAAKGRPDARWLLEAYYAAHPPLAPGAVPLTAEIVDAFLEADRFVRGTLKGEKLPALTPALRARHRQRAVADWKKLPADKQREYAKMPGRLALQRFQWSQYSPVQRALIREKMGAKLTAQERQAVAGYRAQFAANVGAHGRQMMQNEVNAFYKNMDTIYGSGPYYNSSRGRWEQNGGIVTEYGVHRP